MRATNITPTRHLARLIGVAFFGLGANLGFAAPANDNFSDAQLLPSIASQSFAGSNVGATLEGGEASGYGPVSVWWKWVCPENGGYQLSPTQTDFHHEFYVFTGASLNSLIWVANGYSRYENHPARFVGNSGTTYFFQLNSYDGEVGNVEFSLMPGTPPENDHFSDALQVEGDSIGFETNNHFATTEPGEAGAASVWFKWTAATSGRRGVGDLSSSFALVVDVYQGSDPNSLSLLASNAPSFWTSATVTFDAVAGMEYYFRFSESGSPRYVEFDFGLGVPPANDSFSSAQEIGAESFAVCTSNLFATPEAGEWVPQDEFGGEIGRGSIYYKWTAGRSGRFNFGYSKFEMADEDFPDHSYQSVVPVLVGILSATAVDDWTLITTNAEDYGDRRYVSFDATLGQTYYFSVQTDYDFREKFGLVFGVSPANDHVADALMLPGDEVVSGSGNTEFATFELAEAIEDDGPGDGSIWWSWSSNAAGMVTADTFGSAYRAPLRVFAGPVGASAIDQLTPIIASEGSERIQFVSEAGATYYFGVLGKSIQDGFGEFGECQLNIARAPDNDEFGSATDLGSAVNVNSSSRTNGASSEEGEPEIDSAPTNSVWWQWIAPAAGLLEADTSGSTFDTVLDIFSSAAPGTPLAELAIRRTCNDAAPDGTSRVALEVEAGERVYLRVRSASEESLGDIALHLQFHGTQPTTAAEFMLWGRANLESKTEAGLQRAAELFRAALALAPGDQPVAFLCAIAELTLLQQSPEFGQLQIDLGIESVGTNPFAVVFDFARDPSGSPQIPVGASTSSAIDYANDHLLPALATSDAKLASITDTDLAMRFSDAEYSSFIEFDFGDVQAVRAGGFMIEAIVHFATTYDSSVAIDDVAKLLRGSQDAEGLVRSLPNLMKLSGVDQRMPMKLAIQNMNGYFQAAWSLIGARPEEPSYRGAISLDDLGSDQNDETRLLLAGISAALDGETTISLDGGQTGERVDLSKLLSGNTSIRDLMPRLRRNQAIADTVPDATLGGVLPDGTQEKINDFLRKHDSLYEGKSFAAWIASQTGGSTDADRIAPKSDNDGDRLDNFLEYAFDLDPNSINTTSEFMAAGQVEKEDGTKSYAVSFLRRVDNADLSYVVSCSTDLLNWDDSESTLTQVGDPVPTGDGLTERVKFELDGAPSVFQSKFFRILARQASPENP